MAPSPPPRDAPPILRGEIYWLHSKERGALPGVPHPHVVISDQVFNNSRIGTVVLCGLTTNLKRANEPGNVLLEPGEGGLPRQSVLVVSLISSAQKSDLGQPAGQLSQERVDQVLAGMRFQQTAYFRS